MGERSLHLDRQLDAKRGAPTVVVSQPRSPQRRGFARLLPHLGQLLVAATLVAVIGWPAVVTIRAAATREVPAGGVSGELLSPTPADLMIGSVSRPLDLGIASLKLVGLTEAIALPMGLLLALILFRTDAWGRCGLLWLFGLAAFVPLPLHATSWIGAFGNAGRMQAFGIEPFIVGVPGAAFVHAMAALPWIVLLAGVGLRTVEPELEEAGALEMPAWRVVLVVSLRRSLGALSGAALVVAVLTAGDMTVTDLLQVRSYAEEAYVKYSLGQGPGTAAAVVLPPLLVLGTLVLATARGLLKADPARLASVARPGKLWGLGAWRVPVGILVTVVAGGVLVLPLLTLVWRAGRVGGVAALGRAPEWSIAGLLGTLRQAVLTVGDTFLTGPLERALQAGEWNELREAGAWFGDPFSSPLVESLIWGAFGASASVSLAWSLAWLSRRAGAWRWVSALSVALALATPGPVAGMALVLAYVDLPWVYDTPLIWILAYVLRTFPYALLVLWPALRSIPREYFESAALDGLGSGRTIARVALPATRGAVLAAWCVAFVLALGELPAANLLAPPGRSLIAIEIWSLLHTGVESHLAGVALIMLGAVALCATAAVTALAFAARSVNQRT